MAVFPYISHGTACSILSSSKLSAIPMSDRKIYREDPARPTLPPVRDLFRGRPESLAWVQEGLTLYIDELSRSPRPPMNLSAPWITPGPRVDQSFDRSFSRAERRQDSQLDGPGVQVHSIVCSVSETNVLCSALRPRLPIIPIPHSNAMMDALDLAPCPLITYHHL